MDDLEQKINGIKWLKVIGVDYYCSDEVKQPTIEKNQQDVVIPAKAGIQKLLTGSQTFCDAKFWDDNKPPLSTSSRQLADSANSLEELRNMVANFDGCDLKKLATNTVFSDGTPSAPFMLVGEAPGATEDKMGIPFCGESGKLLDKMIACVGITRSTNAYITNTVFWRPPANREPTQEEIEICRPFVEKHIALINPKLIILVGSTAATSLLGKHAGISKIRKEYYSYSNKYLASPIPTTALFHPAYLLRQPMQKKATWYDLLHIQQFAKENSIYS